MRNKLGNFSIVIDSNEASHGKTWKFPSYKTSVVSLLKYGCDYSVRGQLGTIGVERKSYSDYVRCLGVGWTAFEKQLIKLQRNAIYCIIVEGKLDSSIHEKSLMTHEAVIRGTAKVVSFGIPVVFASTRLKARDLCIAFFKEAIMRIQDGDSMDNV